MSGIHKYPTISFRISPREKEEIEAKILVSGLSKKDYFVRSCIYNRVCVVGKKELVYKLVQELRIMRTAMMDVAEQLEQGKSDISTDGLKDLKNDYMDILKAIIWMLDGAKYLWENAEKNGVEESELDKECFGEEG